MRYDNLLEGVASYNYLNHRLVYSSVRIDMKEGVYNIVIDEGGDSLGNAICYFKTLDDLKRFSNNMVC